MELGMANHLVAQKNIDDNVEAGLVPPEEEVVQQVAEGTLPTEVIEEKNKIDKYTNSYNSVQIRNETEFALTEEMLTPDVQLGNKKDILLFHTHTCEAYTPTEKYNYEMGGTYRTTDLNYTVSRVGDELEKYLKGSGHNVIHDKTIHDFPAYSGSYDRSMETVQNLLNANSGIDTVIDIHRDAIGNNVDYAPKVKIGEETAAQIMFVIGTNGGGLEHPDWISNLKFAIQLQQKANELYPGLCKPIILRNYRYNQNLAKGAIIMEVGSTGNTLEEALVSMKYFSKVLEEVLKILKS